MEDDNKTPAFASDVLLNLWDEGRKKITEIISRQATLQLYQHLHNGNDRISYVMAFRGKDGKPVYRKAKTKPMEEAIVWALNTIEGKVKPGSEIAFSPYATNPGNCSCWGAMDFDNHTDNPERARQFAFAAFDYAKSKFDSFGLILEHTGAGGWHAWLISPFSRPCEEWANLLEGIATAIDAPIVPGVCEITPSPESGNRPCRKSVRAPGTWNPRTGTVGELIFENAVPLLAAIQKSNPLALPNIEKNPLIRGFGERTLVEGGCSSLSLQNPLEALEERSDSLSKNQNQYLNWAKTWSERFDITQRNTRHYQLEQLTGAMFNQVGYQLATQVVLLQFQSKSVTTEASEEDHLAEFRSLWRGLERQWQAELPEAEARVNAQLKVESERDCFRILHSFSRKARVDGRADFPIVLKNLSCRLKVTMQRAGQLRTEFVRRGFIIQTSAAVPHKVAARYRWTPGSAPSVASPTPAENSVPTRVDPPSPAARPKHPIPPAPAVTNPTSMTTPPPSTAPAPVGVSEKEKEGLSRPESPRLESDTTPCSPPAAAPESKPRNIKDKILVCLRSNSAVNETALRTLLGVDEVYDLRVPLDILSTLCIVHQTADKTWHLGPAEGDKQLHRAISMLVTHARRNGRVYIDLTYLNFLSGKHEMPFHEAARRCIATGALSPDGSLGLGFSRVPPRDLGIKGRDVTKPCARFVNHPSPTEKSQGSIPRPPRPNADRWIYNIDR
jgi:hypothetical protein